MLYKKTEKGAMYGKTGSGQNVKNITDNNIGWYVGYVTSKKGNYAFACLIKGKEIHGSHARSVIEKILVENNMV